VKLQVLAVGAKAPDWVDAGFREYVRRLPEPQRLKLVEIAPAQRKGWPVERVRADEGERLMSRLGQADQVVALDVKGQALSTEQLAEKLERWRMQGSDVSFLIGGADGLHESCLERANDIVSLSALTFPHHLVRVILAEQIYRAWTVLHGHPYHRS
jgi:23S rRNA (pseudouridine1915-N3)-methyltransferase